MAARPRATVTTSSTYYYSLGGHLIGSTNGSSTQFYLTDALGSILESFSDIANTASVLGNQAFGPYGSTQYQSGSIGTAKGFTGQYQDPSGLDYDNARYYDPVVGLFISADTVQSNQQGMNPYACVGGNPETNIDPSGKDWIEAANILAIAGGVIAVAGLACLMVGAAPVLAAIAIGVGLGILSGMIASYIYDWGVNGTVNPANHQQAEDIAENAFVAGAIGGVVGGAAIAIGWGTPLILGGAGTNLATAQAAATVGIGTSILSGIGGYIGGKFQKSENDNDEEQQKQQQEKQKNLEKQKYEKQRTSLLKKSYHSPSSNLMSGKPLYSTSYSGYSTYADIYYGYTYSVYSYTINSLVYHTSVFSSSNGFYEMSNGRTRIQ